MKRESILSVLSRLVREGLKPGADEFEKDLYELYKSMPDKYVGMVAAKENQEKEAQLKERIGEQNSEIKKLKEKIAQLKLANEHLTADLEKIDAANEVDGGTDRVLGLLAKLMEEHESSHPEGPGSQPAPQAQIAPGDDDE